MPNRLAAAFAAILMLSTAVLAAPVRAPRPPDRAAPAADAPIQARGTSAAKTDTTLLFGGPGSLEGKFQDASGFVPDWQGWTHVDNTASDALWQTGLLNAPSGSQAAWCGRDYEACPGGDPAPGYGNYWDASLVWEGAVADPGQTTDLTVSYALRYETEPNYDFVTLEVDRGGTWSEERSYDGLQATTLNEVVNLTVAPGDLDGNLVRLRLRFVSDGAYSDADCFWPTAAGACQVDDFAVSGTNGVTATLDDFEGGLEDGALRAEYGGAKGDFAKIWMFLNDIDPCFDDISPAVAFIDDGVVEPCTDGTMGISWLYGPGGYCVNVTGGCTGLTGTQGIDNMIVSPPIALDGAGGGGLLLEYDAFLHLPIANGVFHYVRTRTSADGGATWEPWSDLPLLISSENPRWLRRAERLDAAVPAAATHLQVALGVMHFVLGWGFDPDPTPAPYLDNVALKAFPIVGPVISTRERWLAQDAFPSSGTIDLADLGANDVPVDMAEDVGPDASPSVTPGDSLVCDVVAGRAGAVLFGPPRLHYLLRANPLFDPYRQHPASGWVDADTVFQFGAPIVDRWSFDLPDEDFLFPGDILHYYIEATDFDGFTQETTTLPSDLTGFADFPDRRYGIPQDAAYLDWDPRFTVHALPGLLDESGHQPRVLFWDDGLDADARETWETAFHQLCVSAGGAAVDVYATREASAGVGNGLGSRATPAQLAGYDLILYDAGRQTRLTLVGDSASGGDKSDDVALLEAFLDGGGRVAVFGEDVAEDLAVSSAASQDFLAQRLGVSFLGNSILPYIGNQYAPLVVGAGGPAPQGAVDYVVYGGCPDIYDADAVEPLPGTAVTHRWADPIGDPIDGYVAGSARDGVNGGAAAYFAHGLGQVPPAVPGDPSPLRKPTQLIQALADWGGAPFLGCSTGVEDPPPAPRVFAAYPNPFNPEVTLEYSAPLPARAVVEIFDVRGALVRTLHDGRVAAGDHTAVWDGRDDRGADAASGVYFARVRVGEEQRVEKLALVR